uniref:Uncharacterized protein n=1 Tax=Desertifilum tharense IPPAS B-1220 TaxID=1781255 RepID=A0ACD5GYI8_9CYAN
MGVTSWGRRGWGKKKGVGSWELGVGEEEDGGRRRELGVGSWGRRGWGDGGMGKLANYQLSTLFSLGTRNSELGTLFPHPLPTQHSALYTQHLEKHSALDLEPSLLF